MPTRYIFRPNEKATGTVSPEIGDIVMLGDLNTTIVDIDEGTVAVEGADEFHGYFPVSSLRRYDYFERLRKYDRATVDAFLAELLGPLEDSPNGKGLQVYARQSNALQFLYCLLESHASIANPTVSDLIMKFNQLGSWEMANVMFGLQDALRRRLVHAARYWVGLARNMDKDEVEK